MSFQLEAGLFLSFEFIWLYFIHSFILNSTILNSKITYLSTVLNFKAYYLISIDFHRLRLNLFKNWILNKSGQQNEEMMFWF